jgi:hypothetical protein
MGRPICDISEAFNFNRESDFAQDVRDQYLSLVAGGANYFVNHFWRGGLRIVLSVRQVITMDFAGRST